MSTFIESVKAELAKPHHEYEDCLVDLGISISKDGIIKSIKASQNMYWYTIHLVDNYDYREWVITDPFSSNDNKDFLTVFNSYKENGTDIGLGDGYGFGSGCKAHFPGTENIDFNYIKSNMSKKLLELGCKEIYLLIGPIETKLTRNRVEKGIFGKKKYIPYEISQTSYKWAVKFEW